MLSIFLLFIFIVIQISSILDNVSLKFFLIYCFFPLIPLIFAIHFADYNPVILLNMFFRPCISSKLKPREAIRFRFSCIILHCIQILPTIILMTIQLLYRFLLL